MSKFTLSRTIPPAIFTGTILASYALWESHAPYKKEATPQANSCALSFFVISGFASWNHRRYNNLLPGDIESWRIPGRSHETRREDLEQIWIKLDKVFRDAGFTLWTHAFSFVLTIADYPSSSGFGYPLPSPIPRLQFLSVHSSNSSSNIYR